MSLTNESVVVITGAASGIGRALAVRLAQEPIAGIAISDVNHQALTETRKLMGGPELKVSIHRVDVADEAEMSAFAGEVNRDHGRITHVINNAGVALGGTLREVSLDDLRWLIGINFWGVVYGTKLFLPYLEKEKSAHIINFSSVFGLIAPPGQAAYAASKFAVRGFTESLRHELEGSNIAVSVVHPGGVKTNIANHAKIGAGVSLTKSELEKRTKKINRNLSRTLPAEAAEVIVRGIKRRNPRILIGGDALQLSLFARLFPRRYNSIINFISRGKLKVV
ncbi:MAG: SDR family NAD(P)-dependent oxidoreductase [Pyrinomonadaceae bacterium]